MQFQSCIHSHCHTHEHSLSWFTIQFPLQFADQTRHPEEPQHVHNLQHASTAARPTSCPCRPSEVLPSKPSMSILTKGLFKPLKDVTEGCTLVLFSRHRCPQPRFSALQQASVPADGSWSCQEASSLQAGNVNMNYSDKGK